MGNSVSALELKAQWRKPTDIFNILLVVGGDIVRMAYAQLSGRWICPVPLSFGAVAFAYNLLFITFGKGQLMPSNDTPCLVINLEEGNSRECRSWVLGRLWRDHEYWMDDRVRAKLEKVITAKTDTMKENIRVKSRVRQPEHNAPPKPRQSSQGVPAKDLEVQSGELDIENFRRVPQAGLVISVYELLRTEPPKRTDVRPGFPTPFTLDIKWDSAYLSGIITILLQVFVAIMAWLHVDGQGSHPDQGSWAILMITLVGITLSLLIGILPRWEKEKWACRRETKSKVIGLTTGQGAQHLIVFYTPEPEPDEKGQVLNLEDLATGTVSEPSGRGLKALVLMLVLLYTAILICATAVKEDTWYLLAIGGLGMAQNFFAAGKSRKPEHFGISCRYRETFADQKVHAAIFEFMATWDQKCGKNLFPLFFTNGIDGLRKGERETLEEIEKGQRHVSILGLWTYPSSNLLSAWHRLSTGQRTACNRHDGRLGTRYNFCSGQRGLGYFRRTTCASPSVDKSHSQ
jgi:hypothetical protein